MDPPELAHAANLIAIVKTFVTVSAETMTAMNTQQTELNLQSIFDLTALTMPTGRHIACQMVNTLENMCNEP